MSQQSKTMPLQLKAYIKIVAFVFSTSSVTAFILAFMRLMKPDWFYITPLCGNPQALHYFIVSMMLSTSLIGLLNSSVVMLRPSARNAGRDVTLWLLLDSLFETGRVVYLFMAEAVVRSDGPLQKYELGISIVQYLLDSFLYCQMILRH